MDKWLWTEKYVTLLGPVHLSFKILTQDGDPWKKLWNVYYYYGLLFKKFMWKIWINQLIIYVFVRIDETKNKKCLYYMIIMNHFYQVWNPEILYISIYVFKAGLYSCLGLRTKIKTVKIHFQEKINKFFNRFKRKKNEFVRLPERFCLIFLLIFWPILLFIDEVFKIQKI